MTEADLLSEVLDRANELGIWAFHCYDSRYAYGKGFPDLVLARQRIVWAEIKSSEGVVDPMQKSWIRILRRAGQTVHVWYPKDWRDGTIDRVLMDIA